MAMRLYQKPWLYKTRLCWATIVLGFIGVIGGSAVRAQDSQKPDAEPSPATLQQQIDELRKNQEAILKELGEIKRSLGQKATRNDVLAKPELPRLVSLNVHGERFRGDGKARIAMVEYSDFDCSFCAKYAKEIYPHIDRDYIQSGKIKYFFRDLPPPGETNALLKARTARCAGEQDKFWELHDLLFTEPAAPLDEKLSLQAQALGLDLEKLNQCLASGRYVENIERSASGARQLGIHGTPAFVVGTLSEDGDFLRSTNILVGGENYTALKSVLDHLLAAKVSQ
jgi:protein-disulfide isomerase